MEKVIKKWLDRVLLLNTPEAIQEEFEWFSEKGDMALVLVNPELKMIRVTDDQDKDTVISSLTRELIHLLSEEDKKEIKPGYLIQAAIKWGERWIRGAGITYLVGEELYVGLSYENGGTGNIKVSELQNIKILKKAL